MRLFDIKKDKLFEVDSTPFKLEKDIQDLVEKNSENIFNCTFIGTEITVGKYRLDSLCFDEENNSFVIIEYKKGKSYSVIDQGYTYLQLLLNNKSEFILTLSQYYNKVLKVMILIGAIKSCFCFTFLIPIKKIVSTLKIYLLSYGK